VLYGINAALPHMIQRKSGHIITVSSAAGHKVRQGSVAYAATKGLSLGVSESEAIAGNTPFLLPAAIPLAFAYAQRLHQRIRQRIEPTRSLSWWENIKGNSPDDL
jgi:NAD(P)-dependent dehydrogenase (short-subunit alcohol dehydrogenase family)